MNTINQHHTKRCFAQQNALNKHNNTLYFSTIIGWIRDLEIVQDALELIISGL